MMSDNQGQPAKAERITIRLTANEVRTLGRIAKQKGVKVSVLVREAIERFLNRAA